MKATPALMMIAVSLMLGCTEPPEEEMHGDHMHNSGHTHNNDHEHHGMHGGEVETEKKTENGLYHVHWTSTPAALPFNELFDLTIMLHDSNHESTIMDATITVDATMPAHMHGMEVEPTVTANGDGTYKVEGMKFHMMGDWQLEVDVDGPDGKDKAALKMVCCSTDM